MLAWSVAVTLPPLTDTLAPCWTDINAVLAIVKLPPCTETVELLAVVNTDDPANDTPP